MYFKAQGSKYDTTKINTHYHHHGGVNWCVRCLYSVKVIMPNDWNTLIVQSIRVRPRYFIKASDLLTWPKWPSPVSTLVYVEELVQVWLKLVKESVIELLVVDVGWSYECCVSDNLCYITRWLVDCTSVACQTIYMKNYQSSLLMFHIRLICTFITWRITVVY